MKISELCKFLTGLNGRDENIYYNYPDMFIWLFDFFFVSLSIENE